MPIGARSSRHKENDVTYMGTRGRTYRADVVGSGTQLTTPGTPTVTPQGVAGTTTYRYRVSAVDANGVESQASTGGQTTTGNATLDGSNFNRVTWSAVTGAVSYNVYGRTGADGTLLQMKTGVAGLQYDDTGVDTPTGALPVANPAGSLLLRIWFGTKRLQKVVQRATDYSTADRYF
jgi:fibronectin type 3 domain-containing protein